MGEDLKGARNGGLEDETGASPRVMKQLLRTPAFKELLNMNIKDMNPQDAREMAKTLLWEDSSLSYGAMGNLSQGLNFMTAFLDELGQQLQSVPPHLLREFARGMVSNLDKEVLINILQSYSYLLEALFWKDPESRQYLRDGAVETINSAMRLSSQAFEELHTEQREGEILEGEKEVDPEALGELVTSLFKWMGEAAGKDEETIRAAQQKKIEFVREAVQNTDFGKIRSAVAQRAETEYPVYESLAASLVEDPVNFSNLVSTLPPLINNMLRGTSSTVSRVDFPPEILASAVFNLMDDLETTEIAGIINGFSGLINDLHEGSQILGRNEPRFKEVLHNFVEDSVENLDETAASDAWLALMEDMEVGIEVAAEVIVDKPELLEKFFPAMIMGANANLRGFTYLLRNMEDLPAETYRELGKTWQEKADFQEIAGLVSVFASLSNRMLEENPELLAQNMTTFYEALDKEELKELGKKFMQQGYIFAQKEELLEYLNPQSTGKTINSLLASYNHMLEQNPEKVHSSLNAYLQELDPEELSRAIDNTARNLTDALASNPQLVRSLAKSLLSMMRGSFRGLVAPGLKKSFSKSLQELGITGGRRDEK